MSALVGPAKSTAHDGMVTLEVSPSGPYGLVLDPGINGQCAIIKRWERLGNGKFGPVQTHGGMKLNDAILRVNEQDLTTLPFSQAKAIISDTNLLRKVITFGSPAKYHEILDKKAGGARVVGGGAGGRDFVSSVRQARINKETRSPFAEYEVVCKLRLATNKVQKESTLKWSVWHRFSDFQRLDASLKGQLGWQMKDALFPPKRSMTFNKLNINFIEGRRSSLEAYWQQVLLLDRITEFGKHHANPDLRDFLEVNHILATNKGEGGSGGEGGGRGTSGGSDDFDASSDGGGGGGGGGWAGGGSAQRRGSMNRGQPVRRGSLQQQRRKSGATGGAGRSSTSNGGGGGATTAAAATAGGEAAAAPAAAAAPPPPAADNWPEEYDKFFRMLKMHIPKGAVAMKMQAEGFDPSVLDKYDPDGGGGGGGGGASPPAAAAAPPPAQAAPVSRAAAPPANPGKLPSKAGGARGNLLADIAKRRIE